MGEEGEKFLIGFSPLGVVRAPDEILIIVYHKFLVEKEESRGGKEKFAFELGRWKSPEIIKRIEEKENEKSCVFTIGMMCHTVIMRLYPYDEDTDEIAMGRVVVGERPCVGEMEEKECVVLPLIKRCWSDSPGDRPKLKEVIQIVKKIDKPEEEKKEKVKVKDKDKCNTNTKEKEDGDGKDEDGKEGDHKDDAVGEEKEKKTELFCYFDKEDANNDHDNEEDDDVVFDRKAFEKAFEEEIANVRARETETLKEEAEEREREIRKKEEERQKKEERK
jgi:hypothetical protein